ncbi:hypothetical protein RHGRI_006024 [Rhododendron griersonianum]|uniref:NIN-like protein n=1 Tax=Rhododendron griersonianum TaxID=479676 RepID=A0AAV6LEC3_9ERIC|nr:hypothetical protein RHGRI_006024 [Rhododendron griersonianum]
MAEPECGLQQEHAAFVPDEQDSDDSEYSGDGSNKDETKEDSGDGSSEDETKEDFPHDFRELMENQLHHCRFLIPEGGISGMAKVRENIVHALIKLIVHPALNESLVQFWGITKTLEGRTLLTTQFEPFAIGRIEYKFLRHQLCEYRMGMCEAYGKFYADAECEEEQLGLLGRVFLHKLPESTPTIHDYSLKDYPQLNLAIRCGIWRSWAVPVFEHSSHTCVGVLEIVSPVNLYDGISWYDEEFIGLMYDVFQVCLCLFENSIFGHKKNWYPPFSYGDDSSYTGDAFDNMSMLKLSGHLTESQKEFGLRCLDGYKHCKMQYGDNNEAFTAAFEELKMAYESVCKIHNLPLALAWVSCRSCDDLLQNLFLYSVLDYREEDIWSDEAVDILEFTEVSRVCHLRKGQVTERILGSTDLLYCSDVKQFNIAEYPLVPYARYCGFGGRLTMCLQSSSTGDELYLLEFFLPASNKNEEIVTKLRSILGTLEEHFKTFKLVSGRELGDVLFVEVIDFHGDNKSQSIHEIPATDKSQSIHEIPATDPDASQIGPSVVTAEQMVSISSKGKRKLQDRGHGVKIDVGLNEILQCSYMKLEDAAKELKGVESYRVGKSTLKRICREEGISRWPPCNRNIKKFRSFRPSPAENEGQTRQRQNSDLPSNQASDSVAHTKPAFQDADIVTIKAKYENNTIKFPLSLPSRLAALQQEVAKRLDLEAGTYYVKYKDEENDSILIACDEDLQDANHAEEF